MIFGIGTDLIEIQRIREMLMRFPERFRKRVFTDREQAYCASSGNPASSFAKRFAAKEAFLKALGTGYAKGMGWKDVEVVNLPSGQPSIQVWGKVLEFLVMQSGNQTFRVHVSLTDTDSLAQAFVIINMEKNDEV